MQAKSAHKKDDRIEIRKQIVPQLERLWTISPALIRLQWNARVPGKDTHVISVGDSPFNEHYASAPKYPIQKGYVDLSGPIERHGRTWLPLIRQSLDLTCSLNILFLRREDPGNLRENDGDLDNRIKVFLDALQMPEHAENLDGDEVDGVNYRLFENDKLMRELSIDTERLLFPDDLFPKHVHIIAEVKVRVETVGPWNVSLLG
jgi:hypothetical protein